MRVTRVPDLNEVLSYKNSRVLQRFERLHPDYKDKSESIFQNLLKYLWLSKKHESDRKQNPNNEDLNFVCVMHQEMVIIDEMWHTFIIFTKDYSEFCISHFGQFIHHVPNVAEDQPIVVNEFETQTYKMLSYIYDILGEQTLCEWFSEHIHESN